MTSKIFYLNKLKSVMLYVRINDIKPIGTSLSIKSNRKGNRQQKDQKENEKKK